MQMLNSPARNPFLSADKYAITHFDPAQTDAMPYAVPRGTFEVDLRKFPRVAGGPVNIMQLASTSKDYMWVCSSGGVSFIDSSKGGFRPLAHLASPNMKSIPKGELDKVLGEHFNSIDQVKKSVMSDLGLDWHRIANNIYNLVDSENVLYAGGDTQIFAYGLIDSKNPERGIQLIRRLDFSEQLSNLSQQAGGSIAKYGARLVGATLTYDGMLVVLTNVSLTVMNRDFSGTQHTIQFDKGEFASNSVAIDENNGIYVATDRKMYKVVWTGSKLSADEADGAWAVPYDNGREPPNVKFGIGTGSTPTLMGFGDDPDKLVVITDGADQMKLVAFWREEIPQGFQGVGNNKPLRIAGEIQVTCGLKPLPEFIQSEQSVVVKGYGAFVVNNIRSQGFKDKLVDVLAGGPIFEPPHGVERFEWDPYAHAWTSVWARPDVVSTSMVPSVSVPSNIALVNGYTAKDGWEITGMDWDSGQTVHRTIFGQDNLGNGAYALIQFLDNNDLLFNSIGGPTRVHL